MDKIAAFMIEACFLKHIQRSGYAFLGAGRESVAEHVYCATFIAFIMSMLEPKADGQRLVSMCLVHDFPETRIGDLNYVQKKYTRADEKQALDDSLEDIPFAFKFKSLMEEYNAGETLESHLAHDADQLSLIVDLKSLNDVGFKPPSTWLPHVQQRLKTDIGRKMAQAVLACQKDDWWLKLFC